MYIYIYLYIYIPIYIYIYILQMYMYLSCLEGIHRALWLGASTNSDGEASVLHFWKGDAAGFFSPPVASGPARWHSFLVFVFVPQTVYCEGF